MGKSGKQLTRSERNAAWIEQHCIVPEGKLVGRPVKLTGEQRLWLADIYDSPTRLYVLSIARKNAKSATTAFLVLLHLVGPEAKYNSQIYSTGRTRDQAALVFGLASKIVRMSPTLVEYVRVRDTKKQLLCDELGTIYTALSADAPGALGKSPALTIHDELGQVRGETDDLYEAMETATAAQESPLSIIISTQAPTDNDLLSILIDDALTGADPETKCRLYTAAMDLDPFSIEAIAQANPHLDVLMNRAEVIKMAERAKRMPSREASYRNLVLNQRVEARSPFVTRSVWESCGAAPEIEPGDEVVLALDLSAVSDLTAMVMMTDAGDVAPTFWLPGDGLADRSREDRVPYDVWHKQGLLETTPGRTVEYEFVAHELRAVFDAYEVRAVAFDRWNWKNFKPWLERADFSAEELSRFVEFGQGFASMSPALRALESRLLSGQLKHGNHPVLAMCAHNAAVVEDPAKNRKFTKARTRGRIDGMVALAMAVGIIDQSGADGGSVDDWFASIAS